MYGPSGASIQARMSLSAAIYVRFAVLTQPVDATQALNLSAGVRFPGN
jgi:hypothetical protein